MGTTVLFSQMDPPVGREADFDHWYADDHIPARMVTDGFTGAYRYQNIEPKPAHLAVYELRDAEVLQTPEYLELKKHPSALTDEMLSTVASFTRYTLETIGDTGETTDPEPAPFLFVTAFNVPEADMEEFDDWYATEHVPLLMTVDGWRRVRRFGVIGDPAGPTWTRFALHNLDSLEAMDAPQRAQARNTQWRGQLSAKHEWFNQSGRWTYSLISAHKPEKKEESK